MLGENLGNQHPDSAVEEDSVEHGVEEDESDARGGAIFVGTFTVKCGHNSKENYKSSQTEAAQAYR